MTTIPHPQVSPTAVLAFCEAGHTNQEAAEHFGIAERTVRKMKARARAVQPPQPPQPEPASEQATAAPAFPDTADDVAGEGAMWRCPWLGELLPILPGTHRKQWEGERRELQARHRARVVEEEAPALAEDDAPAPSAPALPDCAPGPSESPAAPAPAPVQPEPAIRPGPPALVQRVIVRVPVERSELALVAWIRDRLPPVQVILAWVVLALLIVLSRAGR